MNLNLEYEFRIIGECDVFKKNTGNHAFLQKEYSKRERESVG